MHRSNHTNKRSKKPPNDKSYVKPSIFHPTTSTCSTGSLNSVPASKRGKKHKIRGSGFNTNKHLLSSSNFELSLDGKDMSILTIGQLQEKLDLDLHEISELKATRSNKKSTVTSILKEADTQTGAKLQRGKPKNVSTSFKLLTKPRHVVEASNNYYAKYLAGKSNLNLKSELAFVRKKHASVEGLDKRVVLKESLTTPMDSVNGGYMNYLNKTSKRVLLILL